MKLIANRTILDGGTAIPKGTTFDVSDALGDDLIARKLARKPDAPDPDTKPAKASAPAKPAKASAPSKPEPEPASKP